MQIQLEFFIDGKPTGDSMSVPSFVPEGLEIRLDGSYYRVKAAILVVDMIPPWVQHVHLVPST